MKDPIPALYTKPLYHSLGILLVSIATLIPFSAHAEEDKAAEGNRIHFSITEKQQVENDTISVNLKAVQQGHSAQEVMNAINTQMQKAVRLLKKYPAIVVQTSQYNIRPVHNKQRVISHWTGSQMLSLTFDKKPQLLKSLSELQEHLSYHSMRFSVSDQLKQKLQNKLTIKAIKHFQKQADVIADSFQSSEYKILETRINMPNHYQPMRDYSTARVMAESMAPPAVEAGESTLQVQISGIMLIPH